MWFSYINVSQSLGLLLWANLHLPNWYSFLSLLASTRYLRNVVVLQVLGSFMAVMAAVIASSNVLPFSRTWLPERLSCDRQTERTIIKKTHGLV